MQIVVSEIWDGNGNTTVTRNGGRARAPQGVEEEDGSLLLIDPFGAHRRSRWVLAMRVSRRRHGLMLGSNVRDLKGILGIFKNGETPKSSNIYIYLYIYISFFQTYNVVSFKKDHVFKRNQSHPHIR